MWILDSVARDSEVILWGLEGGAVRCIREPCDYPFYLSMPDPHLHGSMLEVLESEYGAEECRFSTIFGDLEGYRVHADRSVAGRIEQETAFSARLFNVDIRHDHQCFAEKRIVPCWHPGESRFGHDLEYDLRTMEIAVDANPALKGEIGAITVTCDEKERIAGSGRSVLENLFDLVTTYDPQLVLFENADIWVPAMYRKAGEYGIPFTLSRTGRVRKMAARSYWSYGRMERKEGAVIPDGRILIDTARSFAYREGGLDGVFVSSRLSGLCPNQASRLTPGTIISSYEIYEALTRGIAVPYRKSDVEKARCTAELRQVDKGGMMFQPAPGIYGNVCQIDFTSLYPSIIVRYNLSPETVEHPEWQGFLAAALSPLLELRIRTKKLRKVDRNYEGIDAVLKWLLVVCFGYTGYRNARFGRIETHERITAISRGILLRSKDIAEEMGFSVLHGIVDCLWVQGEQIEELKTSIERETRLSTEVEQYSWMVFLPMTDGRSGAYNRYYGRMPDGSIKVRGIAARRHDSPEFVKRMQGEMLEIMGRAGAPGDLVPLYGEVHAIYLRAARDMLAMAPGNFVIRRRISRLSYAHRCLESAAIDAYRAAGIGVFPGMLICYVVRDAGRYVVDTEWDATTIDTGYYQKLVDRAWDEIRYAFDQAGRIRDPGRRGQHNDGRRADTGA
jgi:DNA polymerase I